MEYSHTRLQTYLTCPRSFKHYYLVKARTRKRPLYFVLGEAVHKYIEMFYRTKDLKLAKRQVETVFDAVDKSLLNREEMHDLEVDRNTALGIAEAYPLFYKSDFDEFKNFLTEQKFSIQLSGSDTYGGILDALLQDHAGAWWILETKTTSAQAINVDYFEKVKIDSQVAGYMHGAKQILGEYPSGVIYNVIKKPSIRLKNGESLADFQRRIFHEYTKMAVEKNYFMRQQLMVATHRLDTWLEDTTKMTAQISASVEAKSSFWPMNTGACQAKFGTCPYLPVCTTGKYSPLLYVKEKK